MDKSEILKQAKSIMDNFHGALKDVEELEESRVERDECERKEVGAWESDPEFRKIMFENAPHVKDDCIEAEKGAWT
jgi:hypothetical protein